MGFKNKKLLQEYKIPSIFEKNLFTKMKPEF